MNPDSIPYATIGGDSHGAGHDIQDSSDRRRSSGVSVTLRSPTGEEYGQKTVRLELLSLAPLPFPSSRSAEKGVASEGHPSSLYPLTASATSSTFPPFSAHVPSGMFPIGTALPSDSTLPIFASTTRAMPPPLASTSSSRPQDLSLPQPHTQGESTFPPLAYQPGTQAHIWYTHIKGSRSRTGCLTCRRRKVKCDEEGPVCKRCRIGFRECDWEEPTRADPPKKKRGTKRKGDQMEINSGDTTDTSPSLSKYHPHPHRARSFLAEEQARLAMLSGAKRQKSGEGQAVEGGSQPRDGQAGDADGVMVNGSGGDQQVLRDSATHIAQGTTGMGSGTILRNGSGARTHDRGDSSASLGTTSSLIPGSSPLVIGAGEKGKEKSVLERGRGVPEEVARVLVPDKMRVQMMLQPNFVQPYFPSMDERLVLHHYLNHTVGIILANEPGANGWNPWVTVHAPLAFASPPGVSHACDALRIAILTVGSVHLRHQHEPGDQDAVLKVARAGRTQALALIKRAQAAMDEAVGEEGKKDDHELILATLLSCCVACSLSGDDAWSEILNLAISHIKKYGGAQQVLRMASRTHLSPFRFCLEQLAIRDVFGCMTTGMEPSLLTDAFLPWFFEAETWSGKEHEWESVELMFGLSRGMIDLIARACIFVAKIRKTGYRIQETGPSSDLHSQLASIPFVEPIDPSKRPPTITQTAPPSPTGRPSKDASGLTETPAPLNEEEKAEKAALQASANDLMAELRLWDSAASFIPLHPRCVYGNIGHRYAMRIHLLRNVFGVKKDDERVVKAADAILELAQELFTTYGRITWYTWPVLMAGLHFPKDSPKRQTALDLLGEFGPHACFDNQWAIILLRHYWSQIDDNDNDLNWWDMVNSLGKKPFFD